jgi:hypothetical protein
LLKKLPQKKKSPSSLARLSLTSPTNSYQLHSPSKLTVGKVYRSVTIVILAVASLLFRGNLIFADHLAILAVGLALVALANIAATEFPQSWDVVVHLSVAVIVLAVTLLIRRANGVNTH